MVPDRDAYDRVFASAIKSQTDLLTVNEALANVAAPERLVHLTPVADVFRRAELAAAGEGPPVFALIVAPPQTAKTGFAETTIARWVARRPRDSFGWLSYGSTLAREKSRNIRDYVRRLGVGLRRDTNSLERWMTNEGGGLLAKGLNGPVVGMSGLTCIIVDDPYSSRDKAFSQKHRAWIRDQVKGSVFARRSPRTSIIIQHHRWAVDDLIGWAQEEYGDLFGEPIVIAAVDDETGDPLVTFAGRDRAYYEQQKKLSANLWWPLYMGAPRDDAGALFRQQGVIHYEPEARPAIGMTTIGLDFAYSEKKSADWSVAVVLRRVDQRAYVLEVLRMQVPAPQFAEEVKRLAARYGGAPLHAYAGGTEKGIGQFWASMGIQGLTMHAARMDKIARAQATAAAWNQGNILIPSGAPWAGDFVAELLNFGAGGHDDQVDALVGAHDHNVWVGATNEIVAQPRRVTSYGSNPRESLRERLAATAEAGKQDVPAVEERFGSGARSGWRPGTGRLPTKHGW